MPSLSQELDQSLLDLAWSLWTELGVAGVKRKHQNFLIGLEELILLTVALKNLDPRLRDESLDWCSEYHHFVSISRLKTLMKGIGSSLNEPFSSYSATLNSISRADWPLFEPSPPFDFIRSRKSVLRPLESPALLNIRARSIFGTGARADIITFFFTHSKTDFSAADVAEIGYTKRNVAEILEGFTLSGLLDKFLLRNQLRYRLNNDEQLIKFLEPIPSYAPSWQLILEVLFPIRNAIKRSEKSSESTQLVKIRNILLTQQNNLQRLNLTPPPYQTDFQSYWSSFTEWLLEIVRNLAHGDFPDNFYLTG
jgi:hypothetical protein